MSDRLEHVRASLLLVRRTLEWQVELVLVGAEPDPEALAEVTARLDEVVRELDAIEAAGPSRGPHNGEGRHERG